MVNNTALNRKWEANICVPAKNSSNEHFKAAQDQCTNFDLKYASE